MTSQTAHTQAMLKAERVVKRYGGVVALSEGNLEVRGGEVLALLGANGSGKSTLTKVITGVISPNEGSIIVDGAPVTFANPQAARRRGITAVYQELSLIPDMTVAENIWLTHEPLRSGVGRRGMMRERTQALIDLFGGVVSSGLRPDASVNQLSPDERQIVEILKALSTDPRVFILDEATASLGSQQVERLFDLVGQWKREGRAIIFVSHRMDEIFRVADRATVLRNGVSVGDRRISETDEHELVGLMIEGATTPETNRAAPVSADAPTRLTVNDLRTGILKGISFDLHDGELLGIGGLQGQGQTDLLMALFGAVPHSGQIMLSGQSVHFRHPRQAMKHDVALVPGDRASEGLLLIRSILDNLHLPSWGKYGLPLNMRRARQTADQTAGDLRIVMSSLDAPVSSLSGGNAQKVVIGKWLQRDPHLLLLNDPTKGVDVGAKGEFYALLAQLSAAGTAILFYSSDDEELLGLCNRVLVMHDGHIAADLRGADLTRANLVSASMGGITERASR